jgi:hypothetical protein
MGTVSIVYRRHVVFKVSCDREANDLTPGLKREEFTNLVRSIVDRTDRGSSPRYVLIS